MSSCALLSNCMAPPSSAFRSTLPSTPRLLPRFLRRFRSVPSDDAQRAVLRLDPRPAPDAGPGQVRDQRVPEVPLDQAGEQDPGGVRPLLLPDPRQEARRPLQGEPLLPVLVGEPGQQRALDPPLPLCDTGEPL